MVTAATLKEMCENLLALTEYKQQPLFCVVCMRQKIETNSFAVEAGQQLLNKLHASWPISVSMNSGSFRANKIKLK